MKTYYKREDQTRIGYILAESAHPLQEWGRVSFSKKQE
jgi:hypothetical protein